MRKFQEQTFTKHECFQMSVLRRLCSYMYDTKRSVPRKRDAYLREFLRVDAAAGVLARSSRVEGETRTAETWARNRKAHS